MHFMMERWYSATGQRFSMRSYSGAPEEEDMSSLRETVKLLSDDTVRIVLCQDAKVFTPMFLGRGKVKGTECFAAIIQNGDIPERCGYIGEAFALECTALGLGTCWIGGTYKKNNAAAICGTEKGEKLAAIIAFGKPGETYIGRPRKELAVLTGMTQEQLIELPEWQQYALSCARIAPSAVNAQPWTFKVNGNVLAIKQSGVNFGFAKLDQGIAMLHLELGAAHGSVAGKWKQEADTAIFTPLEG